MTYHLTEATKDPLLLLFAALGITFQPHIFAGGLFFALFAAAVARRLFPEDTRVEWGWTLALAALLATLVALALAQAYPQVGPPLIPQVAMAVTGFLSRWLARVVVRMAGSVESRTDVLFDRLLDRVLPPRQPRPPSDEGGA